MSNSSMSEFKKSSLNPQVFKTQVQLKFRDTDPAGIMYFANIFSLAHDAFEEFIVACGFTWKEWYQPKEYAVPIRHCESDFKRPLKGGEIYQIHISIESFGESSFVVRYNFFEPQKEIAMASVKTVHSILDFSTFTKRPLPAMYKDRLSKYLCPSSSNQ